MISLAPGLENAGNGRNQIAGSDCSDVVTIFDVKIRLQPRIEPRRSVPNQCVEIVAHRVERIMPRRCLHGSANIAEGSQIYPHAETKPELGFHGDRPTVCQQLLVPTAAAYG